MDDKVTNKVPGCCEPEETASAIAPICPYCGCEQLDPWEILSDDGDTEDIDCECGKTFRARLSISVTFIGEPIEVKP